MWVNAVEVIKVKVEKASSKALELAAYRTAIIYLPFPRLGSHEDRVVVSEGPLYFWQKSARIVLGY